MWRSLVDVQKMSESPKLFDIRTGNPRAGIHAHLIPAKEKLRSRYGTWNNNPKQGYNNTCQRKTKYNCSKCPDNIIEDEKRKIWL